LIANIVLRIFAFRRASLLEEHHITHVLSVIKYSLDPSRGFDSDKYKHLSIDIDDVEEADILVHLPRIVRFINQGLSGATATDAAAVEGSDARDGQEPLPDSSSYTIMPAPPVQSHSTNASDQLARLSLTHTPSSPGGYPATTTPTGAVLVHCAMGKSRSVTAVVAYLLWKYPHRFGAAEGRDPDRPEAARAAVARALKWVRQTRGIAEPNDGFMRQLELWWEMGCPAESDDAVEKNRVYRRWAYRREVEEAAKLGMAPDRLLFEDEEEKGQRLGVAPGVANGTHDRGGQPVTEAGLELRCKKCRRVLATKPFIVAHDSQGKPQAACSHFIEPVSWMRPTLEEGLLEGRLVCPGAKCGASIGRYSWQGFKCSCGEWVCPAFCLQRSKVDEVATSPPRGPVGRAVAGAEAERMAALGIRLPPRPGAPAAGATPVKQNL
jgi:dual specificity phosphatase 12